MKKFYLFCMNFCLLQYMAYCDSFTFTYRYYPYSDLFVEIVFPISKSKNLHTANDGPVRIQQKCLVPIYVFPETVQPCYFQNRYMMFCLPIRTLIYSICERFIYCIVFPGAVCLFCCSQICGPILRIYKSPTDT